MSFRLACYSSPASRLPRPAAPRRLARSALSLCFRVLIEFSLCCSLSSLHFKEELVEEQIKKKRAGVALVIDFGLEASQ